MRRLTRRWPFPGDTATDRARQVAAQYRTALTAVDPVACAAIDAAAHAVGEAWVTPTPAIHDDTDLVSVADAADLVARSVRTLYNWVADRSLPVYPERGKIRVLVGDARRVDAAKRAATLRRQ